MIDRRLIMLMTLFVINNVLSSVLVRANSFVHVRVKSSMRETAEHKAPINTNTSLHEGNSKDNACNLKVNNVSSTEFSFNILKYGYNFVYLKLNFVNFSVDATQRVIAETDWIWTFKGEEGAHQYLYIPEDFGYLSFGLLWAHTMRDRISLDIEHFGECGNLTIGTEDTDFLIGQALGNMTSEIASTHEMYNSSHWCYNKRVWLHSTFLYELCRNSICTFQTIEYECCKFHFDYIKRKRTIHCHTEHYHYGVLWWVLPIITGNICFAFYPLLLTKLGMKLKKSSKTMKKDRSVSVSMFAPRETFDLEINTRFIKSSYLSLKSSNPISVYSTLFSPFYGIVTRGSRALRIWIIILPMCLSAIRVLLDYIYANEFVVSAVQKGALMGFSAFLAGTNEAREHFVYVFGGPVTATSICFSFGCLLIVFPSNLENFVTSGIGKSVKKYVFLMRMPLKLKEKLSLINVRHCEGCKKLHNLFLAQIIMLIHCQFWRQSIKLFYLRWRNMIFTRICNIWENMFVATIISVIILPFYIVFCFCELLLAIIYYLFPVVNCFFIVLNSFSFYYNNCFQQRGLVMKCLQYTIFIPMLILFCISWYMYCIIFFDGFWFLSKIAMLTYSGIVAYPTISYGYLVLAFMTLFYMMESINAFEESYIELLKMSLESCEKFQQKHVDDVEMDQEDIKGIRTKYGIKIDLFFFIISRNLPRRNQLLMTLFKLTTVLTVLLVSVKLLVTFDRFKDLSLIMHVFTVLFVCAVPKIITKMCLKHNRNRTKGKMKQKVFRTISDYVESKKKQNGNSSDEHSSVFVSNQSVGYESFMDCSSDNDDTDT